MKNAGKKVKMRNEMPFSLKIIRTSFVPHSYHIRYLSVHCPFIVHYLFVHCPFCVRMNLRQQFISVSWRCLRCRVNVVEKFNLRIRYNSSRMQYVDESFKHQKRHVAVWNNFF
jgi:hypothetical protein